MVLISTEASEPELAPSMHRKRGTHSLLPLPSGAGEVASPLWIEEINKCVQGHMEMEPGDVILKLSPIYHAPGVCKPQVLSRLKTLLPVFTPWGPRSHSKHLPNCPAICKSGFQPAGAHSWNARRLPVPGEEGALGTPGPSCGREPQGEVAAGWK